MKRNNSKNHNKPTSNKYCYQGLSPIQGKGLFARVDLEPGTVICEYDGPRLAREAGERLAKEGNSYIFGFDRKICIDGSVPSNLARYANHSCSPNAKSAKINGRIYLCAVKPIKISEEITYDYGYDFKGCHDNPCNCGSAECVGYIVPEKYRGKVERI